MSQASTVYTFEITLSQIDRGIFETITFHVGQHPSESIEYLLTRVLAYCIEYTEGIAFTKGLQDSEMPAIWVHDLTGQLTTWIEVGAPSAERLHKASKAADRVSVYTYKDPQVVLSQYGDKRIQGGNEIPLHAIDRTFLTDLSLLIEKRNKWEISITDGHLFINAKSKSLSCSISTCFVAE